MAATPRPTPGLRLARRLHRRCVVPLLDFVLPSTCAACGDDLGALTRHGVCAACWRSTVPLGDQCPRCALPTAGSSDLIGPRVTCGDCPEHLDRLQSVYGLWRYDDVARGLLLRAKLTRRYEWLVEAGETLGRLWQLERRDDVDAVVAVPSHPWVSLRRGFSPAGELARGVARRIGRPYRRGALIKHPLATRFAKRQTAHERLRSPSALRAIRRFDGKSVLLVDDVLTTGATLAAAASLLDRSGAAGVHAAVWARTLPPSLV